MSCPVTPDATYSEIPRMRFSTTLVLLLFDSHLTLVMGPLVVPSLKLLSLHSSSSLLNHNTVFYTFLSLLKSLLRLSLFCPELRTNLLCLLRLPSYSVVTLKFRPIVTITLTMEVILFILVLLHNYPYPFITYQIHTTQIP